MLLEIRFVEYKCERERCVKTISNEFWYFLDVSISLEKKNFSFDTCIDAGDRELFVEIAHPMYWLQIDFAFMYKYIL